MVEGLDTAFWVMGLSFVICLFFRLWWVAALVTAGIVAMLLQGQSPLNIVFTGAIATGLPAFGGAALGKFLRRRRADPFDPSHPRDL